MIDAKVVEALIAAHVHEEQSALADLTQRELEILSLIAQGQSNQAIAESLVLSKRAVEKHINAIFVKLGLSQNEDVSRRVKAALIYLSEDRPAAPEIGTSPLAKHMRAGWRAAAAGGKALPACRTDTMTGFWCSAAPSIVKRPRCSTR